MLLPLLLLNLHFFYIVYHVILNPHQSQDQLTNLFYLLGPDIFYVNLLTQDSRTGSAAAASGQLTLSGLLIQINGKVILFIK